MNLRSIANLATRAVNPNVSATVQRSTGYTTGANGKQVPSYAAPSPVVIQAQALSKREIEHLDSMNLSNATRAVYANVLLTGVDRVKQSGGDLLTFDGAVWLVVAVLEDWSLTAGWCKVALSRQKDAPAPSSTPSLNFTDANNSMYLGALIVGGPAPTTSYSLDFTSPANSGYIAAFA